MYLLKISNSTLTTSFFFRSFKLVNLRVWGITVISKDLLNTFEIVNDTPFIDIEAFSIRDLYNLLSFNSNFIIHDLSIISIFLILAVVSTWPWT